MTNENSGRSQRKPKRPDEEPDEGVGDATVNITTYDFEQLSQGSHYLLIRLAGEIYTLRKTQSGKLILNK